MYLAKSLALAAAAAILLWGVNAYLSHREDIFYTAALRSAHIAVSSNASLTQKQLAYAKALAQNNPLLALPGADLSNLRANIALLPTVEQTLEGINASSSDAALLQSLYPVRFLSALADAEAARREFIQSGTIVDEAAYYSAAEKAFAAYPKDARAYASAFTQAIPVAKGELATDGDIVSRTDILSGVDTLVAQMHATSLAFAMRERCTRGQINACDAADLATPVVAVTTAVPISSTDLAQAQRVRGILAQAHDQSQISKGPMLFLPSTKCVANAGGAPLFTFYTPTRESRYSGTFPLYTGNIRFHSLATTTDNPAFTLFSNAISRQVTYLYDSPMLHYSCEELDQDSSKLFVMQSTYAYAQTHALSSYATTSADHTILATLEKKNLTILTEHDVEAYLNAAQRLALPNEAADEVRNLSLGYMFNSNRFDSNIGEILNDELSNSALVKLGWPIDLEVPYVFFVRSSFSMLLLAGNRSAVGAPLPTLFEPNTIPQSQTPYFYYSDLPHTQNTIAQLAHDIHFFYIVHVDSSVVTNLFKG